MPPARRRPDQQRGNGIITPIRTRRRHAGSPAVVGSCPLCGSARAELLRRDCGDRLLGGRERWEIVQCRDCGLARTEPRPRPAELARFYQGHYFNCLLGVPDGHRPGPARPPVSRIRRALSRVLDAPYHARYGPTGVPGPPRPGAAMLDIGPGAGDELAEHARRGWEVWTVEPSRAVAEAVAARIEIPPERVIVAPAEQARLPHGRFDRVVMSHVVEHLSDPRGVVQRVRASMRPGGALIVRCPNFGSIERRLFGRWWSGLDVPRHLQHFTPQTLARLLRDCGLHTVNIRPQLEYASPSFSLGLALHDWLGRQTPFNPSERLYLACVPAVALGRMLGAAGMIEVEAS